MVNPGGTNEAFARSRYRNANLRIHGDNRTIFKEIAEGRADVMVTDLIEQLWAGRDSRLCWPWARAPHLCGKGGVGGGAAC